MQLGPVLIAFVLSVLTISPFAQESDEALPIVPERLIVSMPKEGQPLKMSVPAVAWSKDGTRVVFLMMMMGKKKNRVVPFSTSVDRKGKVKLEDHGEYSL